MIDITIVSSNPRDYDRIIASDLAVEPYVVFIDEVKEKTKAYDFKSQYGARLSPFILVSKDFKDYYTFYKEIYEDPIRELIQVLNSDEFLTPKKE